MIKNYESLMHSFEDWDNLFKDKKISYCYEIKGKDQILFYFGANHSRDPKNHQFDKLRKYWKEFLNETSGQNCLVLTEGETKKPTDNEEQAIIKYSESGLVSLLAKREGIEAKSADAGYAQTTPELLKQFSREEVIYHFFAQMIYIWSRMPLKNPDFENEASRFLNQYKEAVGWTDFDVSLDNMKKIHKKFFNQEFDEAVEDEKESSFFYNISNPTKDDTKLNKVARQDTTLRNSYIIQNIKKYWEEKKNLFVVFGSSHPIMQEPALRKLLK